MDTLTSFDRGAVNRVRHALAASHAIDIGTATDVELCREIGGLQHDVESLLRVIDGLTNGTS